MSRQWRVAKSLDQMLAQINQAAPHRSKASDGSIGDADHAARTSDHNPYIIDKSGYGVVRARDFTHDPLHGFDSYAFARDLVSHKENWPRLRYVISNYQIWTQAHGWIAYHGSNPHDHHVHVSVPEDARYYDDVSHPWVFGSTAYVPVPGDNKKPQPAPTATLKRGMSETDPKGPIHALQSALRITADGDFGPMTERALKAFQTSRGLVVDGVAGPQTLAALKASTAPAAAPKSSYERIMEWVFEDEGREMTISADEPGGASRLGVSIDTMTKYLGRQATQDDLRAMSEATAADIYKKLYWTPEIAALPPGLNYAAFDIGVNSGVGLVDDLLAAAKLDQLPTVAAKIDALCDARLAYMKRIPTWTKYGKGWTNRVNRVRQRAKQLAA